MAYAAGMNETVSSPPGWLKKRIVSGSAYHRMHTMIRSRGLHTVCREACCPNQGECYSSGTATFMILGDRCTRNCRFCAVVNGAPSPVDAQEARAVAEAIASMQLRYAVLTSVTRDDLADGGSSYFAASIESIRELCKETVVEVLVPDFQGSEAAIHRVADAAPEVFNHNIETVPRLYKRVRPEADYVRSLELLRTVKRRNPAIFVKSGLMVGLGESSAEIDATLSDLLEAGCDILTIGQYLAPSAAHYPVKRYVAPEEYAAFAKTAREKGFAAVVAGSFVRSSYRARDMYLQAINGLKRLQRN